MRTALQANSINPQTWYRALDADAELCKRYARAKEVQCTAMEDEIIDIADAREGDVMVDEDGRRIVDNEAVQRARLRVDARKWVLSKRIPKKYGEKLELGGNPEAPIKIDVTATDDRL